MAAAKGLATAAVAKGRGCRGTGGDPRSEKGEATVAPTTAAEEGVVVVVEEREEKEAGEGTAEGENGLGGVEAAGAGFFSASTSIASEEEEASDGDSSGDVAWGASWGAPDLKLRSR